MAQLFTTTASMLSPDQGQQLQLAVQQLQNALSGNSAVEQFNTLNTFFERLSNVIPEVQRSAHILLVQQQQDQQQTNKNHSQEWISADTTTVANLNIAMTVVNASAALSPEVKQLNSILSAPKLLFQPEYLDFKEHLSSQQISQPAVITRS